MTIEEPGIADRLLGGRRLACLRSKTIGHCTHQQRCGSIQKFDCVQFVLHIHPPCCCITDTVEARPSTTSHHFMQSQKTHE